MGQEWMNVETSVIYMMVERDEIGDLLLAINNLIEALRRIAPGTQDPAELVAVQLLAKWDGMSDIFDR